VDKNIDIKEELFCTKCENYTVHNNVTVIDTIPGETGEQQVCSICGNIFDKKRKFYIICGDDKSEEFIKAKEKLLESEPDAVLIPEEIALKQRMKNFHPIYKPQLSETMSLINPYKDMYYENIGGHHETYKRESPKIGRNEKCTCGSGLKYKNCCIK